MLHSNLIAHSAYKVGNINKRIFGSFLEHLGRAVYSGIYQPAHKNSDKNGFRIDVLNLIQELGVSVVRYPGGNFVSGFNWEDSIGPAEKRPTRLDLAWRSRETNQFGLNEFITWCKTAHVEPMMAINLGTRGIDAARSIIEYCNFPQNSYYSDLRKTHGYILPHNIRLWCLGNEMDGIWQIGHKTAEEYGRLASETARAMRQIDPEIQLIAVGSSSPKMETFPEWELTVLEHCYDEVDYISVHTYFGNEENDIENYLAKSQRLEEFITSVVNTCDYVKAKKRSEKFIYLSLDEWNVWFHNEESDKNKEPWQIRPSLLEDVYTFEDSLVVGCLLITILNHVDRIKITALAQLVNVIAPIMTNPDGSAWRQTIFFPFSDTAKYAKGEVLQTVSESPSYDSVDFKNTPYLTSSVTYEETSGYLTIFAVNRSVSEEMTLTVDFYVSGNYTSLEHTALVHNNIKACNTEENPNEVHPISLGLPNIIDKPYGAHIIIQIPALSWNVIRFKITN